MAITRYLLDTGAMGDFINHRRNVDVRAREARGNGARLGTCMPVVGELYFGIEASATRERNLPKRTGRPMQQIDIQIGAIARSLGKCVVVSSDSDLKAIPGLSVEDWADDL